LPLLLGDMMSLRFGSFTEWNEAAETPRASLAFALRNSEDWRGYCGYCRHFFGFAPAILLSFTMRSIDFRYRIDFFLPLWWLWLLLLLTYLSKAPDKTAAVELSLSKLCWAVFLLDLAWGVGVRLALMGLPPKEDAACLSLLLPWAILADLHFIYCCWNWLSNFWFSSCMLAMRLCESKFWKLLLKGNCSVPCLVATLFCPFEITEFRDRS